MQKGENVGCYLVSNQLVVILYPTAITSSITHTDTVLVTLICLTMESIRAVGCCTLLLHEYRVILFINVFTKNFPPAAIKHKPMTSCHDGISTHSTKQTHHTWLLHNACIQCILLQWYCWEGRWHSPFGLHVVVHRGRVAVWSIRLTVQCPVAAPRRGRGWAHTRPLRMK